MNKVIHKHCGGEIMYRSEIKKAACSACNKTFSKVRDLLIEISIMKLDDSEVVLKVKENR